MPKRNKAVKLFNKGKNFNRGQRDNRGQNYVLPPKDNELFVKFYKGQGIVPEGEWDEFYNTLKNNLPVTFRITGYRSQARELLSNIKGKFFSGLLSQTVDGEAVPPPAKLPWYPNDLAWKVELSRKIVRSHECFSRLHDFLVAETECGAISRQEAVSMIPPLVMDIKSHHKILDMCAAPGSKTAQLIEYLHSSCTGDELPSGYVIANDSDNKRCYLMVHQVKRLQSPCCMIVNHDATMFPKIRTNFDQVHSEFQLFDRILCDVPCSGDGTLRKNVDVWAKWHPLQGANIHGLQSKILRRGCQLLAVGGRVVYSTCSLNPVEDEAVIAEMLRSSQGAMELIDISNELPGLKFMKGLSHWKVMTKTGEWIDSVEEIPEGLKTQYKSTMFPPTPEEAKDLHLHRCMRILPHQQDTGGFFIAALQKVRHLPGSREARMEAKAEGDQSENAPKDSVEENETTESNRNVTPAGQEPPRKKQRIWGYKEDPFFFMQDSDPIWPSIRDFFGLPQDFPVNQIMFRSEQGKRTLYYVSKAIRDIVKFNENSIKFINMGVKAFSRSPSPLVPDCDFRITQECLGILLPLISKRRVDVEKSDAITIISEENPFTSKLSPSAYTQLNALEAGSTVFVFAPSEKDPSPACEIIFCGWRGKTSVRCFGSRCERAHCLMLLGEDLKEINKRVAEEKAAKEKQKKEQVALSQEKIDDDLPPLEEPSAEGKDTETGTVMTKVKQGTVQDENENGDTVVGSDGKVERNGEDNAMDCSDEKEEVKVGKTDEDSAMDCSDEKEEIKAGKTDEDNAVDCSDEKEEVKAGKTDEDNAMKDSSEVKVGVDGGDNDIEIIEPKPSVKDGEKGDSNAVEMEEMKEKSQEGDGK